MVKVKVAERSINAVSANLRVSISKPKNHTFRWNSELIRVKTSSKILPRARKIAKNFTNSIRQPWESWISWAVKLFALSILLWMIVVETNSYYDNPMGTTVEDDMYPIQNIDFPGIAICNINLISRERTYQLAEELWTLEEVRNIENITLDRVKHLLRYMGHLFSFRNWEEKPGDLKLLDKIFNTAFGGEYNILKIMEDIVPKCLGFFKYCGWAGEIRACEELFVPRWTQDGHCCTFNYVRWTESFSGEGISDFKVDIKQSETPGIDFGLRVLLTPQLEDYYYTVMRARGFKILLYSASDYPDAPSGGLREVLVNPQSELLVQVKATSFYSAPEIKKFDERKRRCLFNSELHQVYKGDYSYSQCMMLCRTRDIFKTCKCVPLFYPTPKDLEHSRDCNLNDLTCLRLNRVKWWSVKPDLDKPLPNDADDEAYGKNLRCNCLPACETVEYGAFLTSTKIRHSDTGWNGFAQNDAKQNTSDNSILVTISFESNTIIRLRQDVLYYWYDLMSSYGGLCSICLGLSILTPIELVYLWCTRKCPERKATMKISANDFSPGGKKSSYEQAIYWREIIPRKQRY